MFYKLSKAESMTIYFYTSTGSYGCFSNFAPYKIFLKGHIWPTTEHYFQAQKFSDTPFEEIIRRANTAKEAARLGKSRQYKIRDDWESVKDGIMLTALLEKFKSHADICKILLDTGTETLVENSPYDYYWGCGQDGSGKNRLGQLLMHVRALLS